MNALVVFTDADGHPLCRFLHPGFRHCFVCLLSNRLWLLVDGVNGIPVVRYLTTEDFDLAGFWRDQGFVVVETYQRSMPVTAPLTWRNCVGLVKSVLSIRSWSLTPYSLYKHLTRSEHAIASRSFSPSPGPAPGPATATDPRGPGDRRGERQAAAE